jgi:hypothetical protein
VAGIASGVYGVVVADGGLAPGASVTLEIAAGEGAVLTLITTERRAPWRAPAAFALAAMMRHLRWPGFAVPRRRWSGRTSDWAALDTLRWLQVLTHVDAVSIRVCKHETPQSEVRVAHGLDDLDLVFFKVLVQGCRVLDHQVSDVLNRRLVALVQRQVKFGGILLEDHEADGVSVLEDLRKAEYVRVEGHGSVYIAN